MPPPPVSLSTRPPSSSSRFAFYKPEDALPDFSYAGYEAGNAPLPDPCEYAEPIRVLQASGDCRDRTADIQLALDAAGEVGGGIVRLGPGNFHLCHGTILFQNDNVILQGDSHFPSATHLCIDGVGRRIFEVGDINAEGSAEPQRGESLIDQEYVPIGATSVKVQDASRFRTGMHVLLRRPITSEWIKLMQMDQLVRYGKPQTWLTAGHFVNQERVLTGVNDNTLHWQVPITDPIEQSTSGCKASVVVFAPPHRVCGIGIENLHFKRTPSECSMLVNTTPTALPITFGAAINCFARNVSTRGCNEFIKFLIQSRQITLSHFKIDRDAPTSNGGKGALPLDILMAGSQLLVECGEVVEQNDTASYIITTGALAMGPNVISNIKAHKCSRHVIEPHQRWATGLLLENSHVGKIRFRNRTIMGTGHGWTIGCGVVWCCQSGETTVKNAPYTSPNIEVKQCDESLPLSLYHEQLKARSNGQAKPQYPFENVSHEEIFWHTHDPEFPMSDTQVRRLLQLITRLGPASPVPTLEKLKYYRVMIDRS